MIGGKVIGIVRGGTLHRDECYLNVEDGPGLGDHFVVQCVDYDLVRLDDTVWWQGNRIMWTPSGPHGDRCGIDYDIQLQRTDWPHGRALREATKP